MTVMVWSWAAAGAAIAIEPATSMVPTVSEVMSLCLFTLLPFSDHKACGVPRKGGRGLVDRPPPLPSVLCRRGTGITTGNIYGDCMPGRHGCQHLTRGATFAVGSVSFIANGESCFRQKELLESIPPDVDADAWLAEHVVRERHVIPLSSCQLIATGSLALSLLVGVGGIASALLSIGRVKTVHHSHDSVDACSSVGLPRCRTWTTTLKGPTTRSTCEGC